MLQAAGQATTIPGKKEFGTRRLPMPAAELVALCGRERHRHAVHAIALSGRAGAVIENVAQVSATAAAVHFRSRHEPRAIRGRSDGVVERAQKLGQPVPLSNFVSGRKQRQIQPAQW
ncbi:MAG: hypothetical protein R2724_19925 [Bryobacterales bacterium]